MKCRPILVDDTRRELTQHGTRDFPLSMDRQEVASPSHGNVRHWHPEVQIALVTEGEASMSALIFFRIWFTARTTVWCAGTMWTRCSFAKNCKAFP